MTPHVALAAGPAIILIEPQLGENIGMAARAMMNCGLTDMRLVNPRDEWPNRHAEAAASGATAVIEGARVYETTAAAVERKYMKVKQVRRHNLMMPHQASHKRMALPKKESRTSQHSAANTK